jgi:hypothetical protein
MVKVPYNEIEEPIQLWQKPSDTKK